MFYEETQFTTFKDFSFLNNREQNAINLLENCAITFVNTALLYMYIANFLEDDISRILAVFPSTGTIIQ